MTDTHKIRTTSIKPAVTETEVKTILSIIVKIPSKPGYNSYAKTYAAAGMSMSGVLLLAQIPYVLSNLQYWRGSTARESKSRLKEFIKQPQRK